MRTWSRFRGSGRFLSQLLTARTGIISKAAVGSPSACQVPNERADRDHADHGVLNVLDELADRACQGSGQTYGLVACSSMTASSCPAVLGVELDGVLDDRLGCGGVLRQVGRADERHPAPYSRAISASSASSVETTTRSSVLTGKLLPSRGQGLLDGPHHERLTRNRAQVLTRNALSRRVRERRREYALCLQSFDDEFCDAACRFLRAEPGRGGFAPHRFMP